MVITSTLLIIIFIDILLGSFILTRDPRKPSYYLFFLHAISAGLWTFANYMIETTVGSITWYQISFSLGSIVITTGLIWTLHITNRRVYTKAIFPLCLFFALLPFKKGFVSPMYELLDVSIHVNAIDFFLILYALFYLTLSIIILTRLFAFQKCNQEYRYVFFGAFVALTVSAIDSFIFPILSIYIPATVDSIGFLFFLLSIAYTIAKYQLLNIKIYLQEIVLSVLWIMLFIRMLFSATHDEFILNSAAFLFSLLLSILFIQNLSQSIQQREQIVLLTKNLANARSKLEDYWK